MNLVAGRVDGRLGHGRRGAAADAAGRGGRPKARRCSTASAPKRMLPADAGLAGTVAVVEPTGSETHVVLRVGKADLTAVFRTG